MSCDNSGSAVEANSAVTTLAEIGGVRAYRLERDCGVTTVAGVAEMDVDDLVGVYSIGRWTAERILESVEERLTEETVVVVASEGYLRSVERSSNSRPWTELIGALFGAGVSVENPKTELVTVIGWDTPSGEATFLDGRQISNLLCSRKAREASFRASIGMVQMGEYFERYDDDPARAFADRDHELVELADTLVILDKGDRVEPYDTSWYNIDRMLWIAEDRDVDVHISGSSALPSWDHEKSLEYTVDTVPDVNPFGPDTRDQIANTGKPGKGAREEIERTVDSFSDWAHIEDVTEEEKREDGRGVGSKSWSV